MSFIFQRPPFNFQYKVGVENLIDASDEVISKNGVLADNLYRTLIVPANVFVLPGQKAQLALGGTRQNPANTMVVVVRVGATDIISQTMNVNAALRAWFLVTQWYRLGADLHCYTQFQSSMTRDSAVGEVLSGAMMHRIVPGVDFGSDLSIQLRVTINGAGDNLTNNIAHLVIE